MPWADPLAPPDPSSLLRGSPEAGGDVFSRTQAKTGFLRGTGTGHQVPGTLEPLGTPQICPTQSRAGPILGLELQSCGKGAQTLPGGGGSQTLRSHRRAALPCGVLGATGRPEAPLPTRAARLSGVKQVLQSSAASVTLRERRAVRRPAQLRAPLTAPQAPLLTRG